VFAPVPYTTFTPSDPLLVITQATQLNVAVVV